MIKGKWLMLVVSVIFILTVAGLVFKKAGKIRDFRMAKVDENGIELNSYSFKRKMVSTIKIDKAEKVWVPEGYGWYEAGSIKKLLDNEKKPYLIDKMLFYGLGFDADLLERGDRSRDWQMIIEWGWWPWLRYKLDEPGWLYKEEALKSIGTTGEMIDRIMIREMADSEVLESRIRLAIYNASGVNGLAAFVGKNIERLGYAVSGWETVEPGGNMMCKVIINNESSLGAKPMKMLLKQFSECEKVTDNSLSEDEVEIYFGEKFAQMINYKSYVGTF